MASSAGFADYICEQLEGTGAVRSRKMFGEYMVYVNDTLGGQGAARLPAAKINAGGVIVLGGRQPTVVLFLASAGFFSLAGPREFFRCGFGSWQGRRGRRAAARQRG